MAHSKITVDSIQGPRDLSAVFEAAARLDVRVHAGRLSAHRVVLELEPGAPVEDLASHLEAIGLRALVAPGQHLVDALSRREAELVGLLASGLQVKEVARQMGVQTHTAREYWLRVKRKWDVKTVAQAVGLWQEHKHDGQAATDARHLS